MVRGITGINTTKACNFIKNKNFSKAIELPAKISLGTIGSFGIANKIGDLNNTDSFVMKCSDYEVEEHSPADCYYNGGYAL